MITLIICYFAIAICTFFLVAVLRGHALFDASTDSVSALVAAVAWPFFLSALLSCVLLWWLFEIFDLLFYTTSAYFRGRK